MTRQLPVECGRSSFAHHAMCAPGELALDACIGAPGRIHLTHMGRAAGGQPTHESVGAPVGSVAVVSYGVARGVCQGQLPAVGARAQHRLQATKMRSAPARQFAAAGTRPDRGQTVWAVVSAMRCATYAHT